MRRHPAAAETHARPAHAPAGRQSALAQRRARPADARARRPTWSPAAIASRPRLAAHLHRLVDIVGRYALHARPPPGRCGYPARRRPASRRSSPRPPRRSCRWRPPPSPAVAISAAKSLAIELDLDRLRHGGQVADQILHQLRQSRSAPPAPCLHGGQHGGHHRLGRPRMVGRQADEVVAVVALAEIAAEPGAEPAREGLAPPAARAGWHPPAPSPARSRSSEVPGGV